MVGKAEGPSREERRAAALRANLKRRKAQMRARAAEESEKIAAKDAPSSGGDSAIISD
jgi:hypothetical protein